METLMNEDHINDWYKNYNQRKATPRLTEAFVDCQSELMIIDKDKKGRFTYASLEQIIKIVKPILSEAGLHILQTPSFYVQNLGGYVVLHTEIHHRSGEYASMPPFQMAIQERPNTSIHQNVGTAITYARRYQLCGMLCIGTEDIDPDEYHNWTDTKIHPEDLDKIKVALVAKDITKKIIYDKFAVKSLTELKSNDFVKVMSFIKAYK